jgi:uncharacterized protein YbjT (DUF2867 family)
MVRSADKAGALPDGVEAVIGDMREPASLPAAFAGADAVFLLNALSQDETAQGLAAVAAAQRASAKKLVYLSVHRLEEGSHIPHFATKLPVEKAVKESGIAWTILRPNNFYQNDYWFQEAIAHYGLYPQPIGQAGVSRVDVRDIAELAATALTEPGHDGCVYSVVGPEPLSGDQVAEAYAKHLGRPVRYAGDDLDAWAAQARNMLPEWLVHDLCIMYGHFQKTGLKATGDELATLERVLGHAPRKFDDFAAEVSSAWKQS